MKKLLAFVLTLTILCSGLVISTNAAGVIDSLEPVARFNSDGLSSYSNGESVTTWTGSAKTTINATVPTQAYGNGAQATAPKLKENALNGKDTVVFSRSALTALTFNAGTFNDCTIIIVYKNTDSAISSDQFIYRNRGAGAFGLFNGISSQKAKFRIGGINTNKKWFADGSKLVDNAFHIHAVTWDIDSGIKYYIDGDVAATTNQIGNPFSGTNWIGADWVGSCFEGEIAEIIVYDKALTEKQIDMNGLQLARDYGLTWTALSDYRLPLEGNSANRLAGVQESDVKDNTVNIRFIGTIDSLDYSDIGFKVTATFDNQTVDYDVSCKFVFTSIMGSDEMGNQETWDSDYFESKYIYALVIQGVPTNIGEIVFTITPYTVSLTGQELEAADYEVVYNNGEFVSAEVLP